MDFWVKNDQFLISYVYDHTTGKKNSSRLITEIKSGWAKLVFGWVTAWEYFVL